MKKIKATFYFEANDINKSVTYRLIKDYGLELNILHADVSLNKTGKLVVDIIGEESNIEAGLKYVKGLGIKYKIFNKNIIWNEELCVHCGTCTSVCLPGALKLDKNDWSLTFDKEKCLVCELCIKVCPLNVITVSS